MNFIFEIEKSIQFGFENTVSQSNNVPKLLAGITELQLNGTNVYAAGKTVLVEEETE